MSKRQEVNVMCTRASREPPADRLAAALAQLCEREGLDPAETAAVLAVALARTPDRAANPAPLLRRFRLAER
jgi:cobalamin biosynthesis protein CbiG